MKKLLIGLFLVLFGFNAAWAGCEEKYQKQISSFENEIAQYKGDRNTFYTFGGITGGIGTYAIAAAWAGTPAAVLLFGGMMTTCGVLKQMTANDIIRMLNEGQVALNLILEANDGDGVTLRSLLDEIKKDPKYQDITLQDLANIIQTGNKREDFCTNDQLMTSLGIKEYSLKYLNEQ